MKTAFVVEKQLLKHAFGAASNHYDDFAQLQRTVAFALLQLCDLNRLQGTVLDLGCGTGFLTSTIREQNKTVQLTGLDIALPMLEQAKAKLGLDIDYICADAEHLPLQANSFDAVFSNLALQWCWNIPQVLQECQRILKPGGQLAFSTFGSQTLQELKQAWAQVDDYRHVNDFYTARQLLLFLERGGWENCRLERHIYQLEYLTLRNLMQELKGLGAHNIAEGRNKQLTGKSKLRKLMESYPKMVDSERIMASYDVIWVTAEAS